MRALQPGLYLLICSLSIATACKRQTPPPPPPPPPEVSIAAPIVRNVVLFDEFQGRLEASQTVEVRARVGGQLVQADFNEGTIVEEGQLLFLIDERPFRARLNAAEAAVARAESQLALAKADLARGERALAGGALSTEEVDSRRAGVKQAEANVQAAIADRESAQLDLGFCRVTAPIKGRVSRKNFTPGNMITGSVNGASGTVLTVITALDPIYCYVDADERAVLKYQRYAQENKRVSARDAKIPAWLKLFDEREFRHEGVIDFVDNRVNPTTGTLRARGAFSNPDGFLVPGFFGYLRVPDITLENAVLVLDEAIATDQNRKYVLVVDDKNIVQYRKLELGPRDGHMRVVTSGLSKDDRVIVNGTLRARPGAPVNPKLVPMPTEPRPSVAVVGLGGSPGAGTRPATQPASQPATQSNGVGR